MTKFLFWGEFTWYNYINVQMLSREKHTMYQSSKSH